MECACAPRKSSITKTQHLDSGLTKPSEYSETDLLITKTGCGCSRLSKSVLELHLALTLTNASNIWILTKTAKSNLLMNSEDFYLEISTLLSALLNVLMKRLLTKLSLSSVLTRHSTNTIWFVINQ